MKKFILIGCIFLIAAQLLNGQEKKLIFNRLTIENGLSSNNCGSIAVDTFGYIWISSYSGLDRYDGINIKQYEITDLDSVKKPNITVYEIISDKSKQLWVGSDMGLSRYNHITDEFITYKKEKQGISLENGPTKNFIFTNDNKIWLEQGNKIALFDMKTEKCIFRSDYKNNSTPNEGFNKLNLLDKKNRLWALNNDIYCFEIKNNIVEGKKVIDSKKYNKSRFNSNINKFAIDPKNSNRFFFANHGLYEVTFNDELEVNVKYIDIFNNLSPKSDNDFIINNMVIDENNILWISTNHYGVKNYNLFTGEVKTYSYSNYFNEVKVNKIFCDKQNNVWLFGFNNSLFLYQHSSQNFINYSNREGDIKSILPTDDGSSFITIDQGGTHWLSTYNQGTNFFNLKRNRFEYFNKNMDNKYSLRTNVIGSVCEDSKGRVWIGANGLNIYDPTKKQMNFFSEETDKNFLYLKGEIRTIFEFGIDTFFVDAGCKLVCYKYDGNKLTTLKEFTPMQPNSLVCWCPTSIYKDSQQDIWIGTVCGLSRVKFINRKTFEAEFTNYPSSDDQNFSELKNNVIWNIFEDSKKRIWICTGTIVYRFNEERTELKPIHLKTNKSETLAEYSPKSVVETSDGLFWIATEGLGLFMYDENNNKIVQYSEENGLPSRHLRSLYKDKNEILWMGSANGIILFDPKSKRTEQYTQDDGLLTNELKSGASHKGKSGKLYFGSSKGLIAFMPEEIKEFDYNPKIVFCQFKLFNEEIAPLQICKDRILLKKNLNLTKEIVLHFDENIFSVEFAALDFAAPFKIKYKYKLEGFDKNWITVGHNLARASYSGIQPGDYKLKVISTNIDGNWQNNERELKITILPPFWQTWWFKIAVAICLIFVIIAYFRVKTYSIRKHNLELERKVAERTHEVMQQKEELQQQAEELEATNEELTAQSDALKLSNEELNQKNNEIEKSVKSSQVISEFGQRVTSTFDLDSINEIVYGYLKAIISIDAFGIALFNENKCQLDYIGFIENGKIIENFTKSLDADNSLSAYCFVNQEIVFINDINSDYKKYIRSIPNSSTSKTPQSIIHIPLSTSKRKIGILAVNSFTKNVYSQKDLINIQSLASYVTIALDNSEAYKTVNAQKQKLLELDNFKDAMTGMIVHDLKNPLNAIIGLSSLNPNDEMMQIVNSAGNQMLNLVLNILDVQKFENTAVKLNISVCSLIDLAKDAEKQVALLINQKHQNFKIEITEDFILSVDSELIVRSFVNMLTNAIKYTHLHGSITINAELLNKDSIDAMPESVVKNIDRHTLDNFKVVLIRITDTGQGIPEDKIHLVFEKFGQVEAKKSGGVRSTGLGMTFCKMVIEAHGGIIWLTSIVNTGTTFWFTLPFQRLGEKTILNNSDKELNTESKNDNGDILLLSTDGTCVKIQIEDIHKYHPEKLKILAVDDDYYAFEVMKNCLSEWHKSLILVSAYNGEKALEIMGKFTPDLILLDWEMPVLNGLETLKKIKELNQYSNTPVVMVTSKVESTNIHLAFQYGAADYINKPIDKTSFLFRMEALTKTISNPQIQDFRNSRKSGSDSPPFILIIDDIREIRKFISYILADKYIFIEADNGIDGIKQAKDVLPDIIISDVNMPDKNGYDLCKELKECTETSHIPIILLTAEADTSANIEGLDAGADAYLTKPVNPELLLAAIRNQIKNREKLRKAFSRFISSEPVNAKIVTKDEKFIIKCIRTVEKNMENMDFHIDDLAKEMNISYAQLYRKIKFLTNMSVASFVRSIRLKRAKQIIETEKLSLKEIIYKVGFENPQSFKRAFVKEFGISPANYKKSKLI